MRSIVGPALPLNCICLALLGTNLGSVSVQPAVPGPTAAIAAAVPDSAPVPGLGPRLAAQIRQSASDAPLRFLARGLSPGLVEAAGGRVTAKLGPVISAWAPANRVAGLARLARFIEAQKPLRPALDLSRVQVQAHTADFAEVFDRNHRGSGVLIAAYDTGIDLEHPDLRSLDGPTRVHALWDQARDGVPPVDQSQGLFCDRESLIAGACPHRDTVGHGTQVLAVAASGGPKYRGIAPEADLIVAASEDFEMLLEALDWFSKTAAILERPMVVNLSLSGQEGPHDGTSLESQALDEYPHLVVVAAGNEGTVPLHTLMRLDKGDSRQAALRFPILPQPGLRRAVVDIWGDVGLPLSVQVQIVDAQGEVHAQTDMVGPGDPGQNAVLLVGTATIGIATLDAEMMPNPFNGQGHVRIGLELQDWEDDPGGLGYISIRVRGEGRVDMWVDSPASEPAPVRFDRQRVLNADDQMLGDTEHTLSDLACTAAVVAVSASVGRTSFVDGDGIKRSVGATLGEIAEFSSYGPTLSPASTGPKPDITAPGLLVVAARSQAAPIVANAAVSPLYQAGAGTSVAAPHVAGAAALLLGAQPELRPKDAKAVLLSSAHSDEGAEADPRWGAGRLDVAAALGQIVERKSGCRCLSLSDNATPWLIALILIAGLRRRRRVG